MEIKIKGGVICGNLEDFKEPKAEKPKKAEPVEEVIEEEVKEEPKKATKKK